MKIKASKIKPGMVININRKGANNRKYEDICLVTATTGHTKVNYTHLDFQDAYGGLLIGTIDGLEEVQIIKGKRRKYILDHIKNDVFRNLHDIENIIDTLRLIEAMERE